MKGPRMHVSNNTHPHLGGNDTSGDPGTYAPAVWDYLLGRFPVRSVLDVGCGLGEAGRWFRSRGCQVLGMDGMPFNVRHCDIPCVQWDLTKGPFLTSAFDLV